MAPKLEIEIWSDLICPFCGLGQQRLNQALAQFPHRNEVTVIHRSFELDPSRPIGATRTVREMLHEKYGITDAQIEAQNGRLEADAAAAGLVPYVTTDNIVGSTALAHELLAYASDQGYEAQAWAHLYRAYFGDVRSIFTLDALVELATEIGLDPDETAAVLTDRRYQERVEKDRHEAEALGASGVPFIVLNRRYGIAGAQSVEVMLGAIERAWSESHPDLVTVGDSATCGPEGCDVPEA